MGKPLVLVENQWENHNLWWNINGKTRSSGPMSVYLFSPILRTEVRAREFDLWFGVTGTPADSFVRPAEKKHGNIATRFGALPRGSDFVRTSARKNM